MASLRYPGNIEDLAEKGAGMIMFTFYERPNSQESNEVETVLLYMPQTLENPMTVTWEQAAGVAQYAADTYRRGGKDKLMEVFEDGGGFAGMVSRWARMFQSTEDVVSQATGAIANPFISMTFKGVGFRQFEMMFKFTPHNEKESDTIVDIIKLFRSAALPEKIDGMTMGFPMEIEIEYEGMAEDWLNKYKRCVLTDVHVNYTSAGFYAAMENGFPAETELRLHFTENELLDRDDIEEGF